MLLSFYALLRTNKQTHIQMHVLCFSMFLHIVCLSVDAVYRIIWHVDVLTVAVVVWALWEDMTASEVSTQAFILFV